MKSMLKSIKHWIKTGKQTQPIDRLNDHLLRDIGLVRSNTYMDSGRKPLDM